MRGSLALVGVAAVTIAATAAAQDPGTSVKPFDAKRGGSPNVHMLAHVVTHKGAWKLADVEMEQDPNRPYVYACGFTNFDVQIYDVRNPSHPKMVYSWTIENPELHRGIGRASCRERGWSWRGDRPWRRQLPWAGRCLAAA